MTDDELKLIHKQEREVQQFRERQCQLYGRIFDSTLHAWRLADGSIVRLTDEEVAEVAYDR